MIQKSYVDSPSFDFISLRSRAKYSFSPSFLSILNICKCIQLFSSRQCFGFHLSTMNAPILLPWCIPG
jgi:hypothetical protein